MAKSPVSILYGNDGSSYIEVATRAGISVPSGQPGVLVIGSDGTTLRYLSTDSTGKLNIIAASLPLPTGAATEATLATLLTQSAFQARINTLGQKTMANSTPVVLASDQTVIPVSDNGSSLTVDGTVSVSGTVAISAVSLPLPTGAATSALQTQPGVDIGDVTVNNTSGAGAVNIQDGGNSITVDGTVSAVQSGTWTVQPGNTQNTTPWLTRPSDGTNNVNVKAASTAAISSDPSLVVALSPNSPLPSGSNIVGSLVDNQTVNLNQVGGNAVVTGGTSGSQGIGGLAGNGAVVAGNPVLIAGYDGTNVRTARAHSTGVLASVDFYTAAAMGMLPGITAGLFRGYITTVATGETPVRSATYVEQTSGAQRSLSSTSASDTSAGTGARSVRITYYTLSAGVVGGPFLETVILNGTTAVNTVATNIALIEKIEVITARTGGVNAGAIRMHTATAGGGSIFVTMLAGDRKTALGIHYVPSGKTAYINQARFSSTAANTQDPLFGARYFPYSISNAAEIWVFEGVRITGTFPELFVNLSIPIPLVGPGRITAYVSPANGVSQVNEAGFSFLEL
jgi:hypothetical protein